MTEDQTPQQQEMLRQHDRARELLLDMMAVAGCSQLGIDAVGFACGCRPLEIAVDRAEFFFNAVGANAPTVKDLLAQV